MSKNKKTMQTLKDNFQQLSMQLGTSAMVLAAVAGMVELPHHEETKIITPSQPIFAFEENNIENTPIRREKETEEGRIHYSYGMAQRTPARSGKL